MTAVAAQEEIVVVDDDEVLVRSLGRVLTAALPEAIVRTFTSPVAALAHMASAAPSVLVTDVQMPEMDGTDLVVRALLHHPRLRCVVMTAYDAEELRTKVFRRGALTYIVKPFRFEVLAQTVRELFDEGPPSGFKGALRMDSLPDLLQFMVLTTMSGTLHIWTEGRYARVWLERGDIVHAEAGEKKGAEAFYDLATWAAGQFEVRHDPAPERTIREGGTSLLMEAYRRFDEAKQRASLPPDGAPLSEAKWTPRPSERGFPKVEVPEGPPSDGDPFAALSVPPAEPSATTALEGLQPTQERTSEAPSRGSATAKYVGSTLAILRELSGYMGSAVIDASAGTVLGVNLSPGTAEDPAPEMYALVPPAVDIMRAQAQLASYGGTGADDVLITTASELHLLRPLRNRNTLFVYLLLRRDRADLEVARRELSEVEDWLAL